MFDYEVRDGFSEDGLERCLKTIDDSCSYISTLTIVSPDYVFPDRPNKAFMFGLCLLSGICIHLVYLLYTY